MDQPLTTSPPSAPPTKPWETFAASLEAAEQLAQTRQRPCRIRMRWEVYDHTTETYRLLRGSTFSFVVARARQTHLAERIWRAIYILLR